MADTEDEEAKMIESLFVTGSTATSIEVSWNINKEKSQNVQGYRVHFQKIGSRYIQNSPELSSTTNEYSVGNLIMDTYYKVCLIMYRNDTAPVTECIDASTANWHIPVSIGSSVGAVLALSIIVFLVFVSRCPSIARRPRKKVSESGKYDSMSSHAHDDNCEFSDTTTQAQDDEMFSDQDSGNFELMQPLQVPSRHHHHSHHLHHHSDRPPNGNRNYIKPNIPAHVLQMHPLRSTSKPHSDAPLYLPRQASSSPKQTPSRQLPGLCKTHIDNHKGASRQLISQKQQSLDSPVSSATSPVQTAGSPLSISGNHFPLKPQDDPLTRGDKQVSTTMPRCSKPVDPLDVETSKSLPRHMAGFGTDNTDIQINIPKHTVAKLEHSVCSRQHTV